MPVDIVAPTRLCYVCESPQNNLERNSVSDMLRLLSVAFRASEKSKCGDILPPRCLAFKDEREVGQGYSTRLQARFACGLLPQPKTSVIPTKVENLHSQQIHYLTAEPAETAVDNALSSPRPLR